MAKAKAREARDGEGVKAGGPPNAAASAYSQGRQTGFVEGFCSALNQGIRWAEKLAPGTGREVADKLIPHLERMFPDAQRILPVLAKLREGTPYDEPAPEKAEVPADEPAPEKAEAAG